MVRAQVEARDALEMVDEVGPERRVDVDGGGHARIHLLLHQRGVEVAGIQGDEADVGHGGAPFPRAGAGRQRRHQGASEGQRDGGGSPGHWSDGYPSRVSRL